MIAEFQKEQTVTRLKKAYSALSQTTAWAIADNGPINTWTVESGKSKEFTEQYLLPYLSIGKICGTDRTGSCNLKYANLNTPTTKRNYPNSSYIFYLQDGTAIIIYANSGGSPGSKYANLSTYIDINGIKGPNVQGKDIFLYIYWTLNESKPSSSSIGKFRGMCQGSARETMFDDYKADGRCAQDRIMIDGWQIKDDYPW